MTNSLYYIVFPFLLFSLCLEKVLFLLVDSKVPRLSPLFTMAHRAVHLNLLPIK